jgi:hypothetical protein
VSLRCQPQVRSSRKNSPVKAVALKTSVLVLRCVKVTQSIRGYATALLAPAVDSWPYIPPGGDVVVAAAAAAAAAAASELGASSSGGVRRSYKDYFPALRSAPVDEIIRIRAGRAGTHLPA